jgi:hypothetical protein
MMKTNYPTWNDFLADCRAHDLDPDRQFQGTYDHDGNLIGSFSVDRCGGGYGAVTYRDLRTEKEKTVFVIDGL